MAADDPFFRTLTVSVTAPVDFERLGLSSVTVSFSYGDPHDHARLERGDLLFTAAKHPDQAWTVYLDRRQTVSYRYQIRYVFNPASSWRAQRNDYTTPTRTGREPTLVLDPAADLTFAEVQVVPHRLDPAEVRAVEVHLTHWGPRGWTQQDQFVLEPDGGAQSWRLRLEGGNAPLEYDYAFVYHLADGRSIRTEPASASADTLLVRTPFAGALDLVLVPQFDPATVRDAFVEVRYEDPGNRYAHDLQLHFDGQSMAPVRQRLPLRDPARTQFSVRMTFVNTNGTVSQGQFVPTTNPRIRVRPGGG
jgi:hypothetical protein